ncbi:hypothetical protein NQ315_013921 [Exocentrus adspersus]|uniref:THAP-type domain-containing protein n=1 Tax=Exocentrus adspersus TaxID=1586481 RepID=A0AAV8VRQ7_9CUCU|nr:hypothetical protein NQ315_013921 [Exocentrus adspersus]
MPVVYCSVFGCTTKRGTGLSFFRCPKDETRCPIWRKRLGFYGNHRYASITPEQCYERIKICSLHFTDNSFMTISKQRLNYDAVPSLFLSRAPTSTDNPDTDNFDTTTKVEGETNTPNNDACVQTDTLFLPRASTSTDNPDMDNFATTVEVEDNFATTIKVEDEINRTQHNDAGFQTDTLLLSRASTSADNPDIKVEDNFPTTIKVENETNTTNNKACFQTDMLFLSMASTSIDNPDKDNFATTIKIEAETNKTHNDACVQTDACNQTNICVQTDTVVTKDVCCQTTQTRSSSTPRTKGPKREIEAVQDQVRNSGRKRRLRTD